MFVNGNDKVGSAKAYATGREIKLEKENKLLASALLEASNALDTIDGNIGILTEAYSSVGFDDEEDEDFVETMEQTAKQAKFKTKKAVELAREIVNKEQQ